MIPARAGGSAVAFPSASPHSSLSRYCCTSRWLAFMGPDTSMGGASIASALIMAAMTAQALADAREACDAVASELEREIAAETIRLAARRAPRRAAAAAVPAVPRTVMEDGKTIWGAWDWEGPAHDAANAAADDARHEALRHDWVEHAATKAKDDIEYKEAVTERSNLYDALGWDDVSAARAASSEALERDMYRQNDAIIEGKRRARVRLSTLPAATPPWALRPELLLSAVRRQGGVVQLSSAWNAPRPHESGRDLARVQLTLPRAL